MSYTYDIIKSIHIFAVIAWMAGLLYLPRLYVYHADVGPGTPQSETFKVMERRLLRQIMNPSMIATWVLGLYLAAGISGPNWFVAGWLHVKLLLVAILTAIHMFLARWRRDFEADRNTRSSRFYRIINEVPAILLLAIIFLVVLKRF